MRIILFLCIFSQSVFAQKVWFSDDFSGKLNKKYWEIEVENKPKFSVETQNNQLILDTKGGTTVWLKKKLTGNYKISYKRKVLVEGKENDRLSDLNQFWLASDPRNENLFTRNGKFEEYDSLSLFYVGIGGNYNTTTRFRKYEGNGERTLLAEKNDFLLEANKEYFIEIIVLNDTTSFYVDGRQLFSFIDNKLPRTGFFGFRSTFSRQSISDFKVTRMK